MAFSTSEHGQEQLYPFSFNSISKRKLEPEDSISLVQENGIFIQRCEKRQKFSTESEEMEELTENSFSLVQHTSSDVNDANADGEMYGEMYDEEMSESSQESDFSSKENEDEKDNQDGIVTNTYAHLQRPRALNCTAPRLHSYCFEHGILDNIIMSYHGS